MAFRVPMVIASPWSRGGWVNSQVFDHTSTLMFLERFFQNKYSKTVKEENISGWRRTVSGDLTSVFRRYDAKEAELDYLNRDKFVVGIRKARDKEIPSNYRKLSSEQIQSINHDAMHSEFTAHQEKGIRPSCALPYELYADGNRMSAATNSCSECRPAMRYTARERVARPSMFTCGIQKINRCAWPPTQ